MLSLLENYLHSIFHNAERALNQPYLHHNSNVTNERHHPVCDGALPTGICEGKLKCRGNPPHREGRRTFAETI
jgi:hypothetical protein